MSSHTEYTKYDIDQMLEVLGSSTRQEIIYWLKQKSYCISDLAKILDLSLPAVSKHIKLLNQVGLISITKTGQKNMLNLNKLSFLALKEWFTL